MKKIFKVLIVEDEQLTIDTYNRALDIVKERNPQYEFNIIETKTCDNAYSQVVKQVNEQAIDLLFLDIQFPLAFENKIFSGEILGIKIRELFQDIKIIVCTSLNDNFRLINILKNINPEGFLIKCDISFRNLIDCIEKIVDGKTCYSDSLQSLLRNRISFSNVLDEHDISILYELSNGAKTKDLVNIIPLSKAGIEKRKRLLKRAFNVSGDNDRELIIKAKNHGFI